MRLAPLYTVTLLTGRHGGGKTTVLENIELLARSGVAGGTSLEPTIRWPGERSTEGWEIEARLTARQGRAPARRRTALIRESGRAEAARQLDDLHRQPGGEAAGEWLRDAIARIAGNEDADAGRRPMDGDAWLNWSSGLGDALTRIAIAVLACRVCAGGTVCVDGADGNRHADAIGETWKAVGEAAAASGAQVLWATQRRRSIREALIACPAAGLETGLHEVSRVNGTIRSAAAPASGRLGAAARAKTAISQN